PPIVGHVIHPIVHYCNIDAARPGGKRRKTGSTPGSPTTHGVACAGFLTVYRLMHHCLCAGFWQVRSRKQQLN
ncbi:MAG TPA: hypothetical protein VIE65_14685, partial [Methylobacter sp.]